MSVSLPELVLAVEEAGARLTLVGPRDDPQVAVAGDVPPEVLVTLRQHKAELRDYLFDCERRAVVETWRLLKEQGWCLWQCQALGGANIVLRRDGGDSQIIPPELAHVPRFTLTELAILVKYADPLTAIKTAYAVKTLGFPHATVVDEGGRYGQV